MAEGRFRFPKTIEEEELYVERTLSNSTRYRNKWVVGIFQEWQQVRSVKSPIFEVGWIFKGYIWIVESSAAYWLSKFVQVAKSSKDPYFSTTLSRLSDSWWKRIYPVQSLNLFRQKVRALMLLERGGGGRGLIFFDDFKKCTVNFI